MKYSANGFCDKLGLGFDFDIFFFCLMNFYSKSAEETVYESITIGDECEKMSERDLRAVNEK